jgi:hypothetical protein
MELFLEIIEENNLDRLESLLKQTGSISNLFDAGKSSLLHAAAIYSVHEILNSLISHVQ